MIIPKQSKKRSSLCDYNNVPETINSCKGMEKKLIAKQYTDDYQLDLKAHRGKGHATITIHITMSFLKRAFGIQDTTSRISDSSGDIELMMVEEGRSVNTDDNASGLLGAGSGGSTQLFQFLCMPADHVPVDNHSLAPELHPGEFPTLQSHTAQLAANNKTSTPTPLAPMGVKHWDGHPHPYHVDLAQDAGRKIQLVETKVPLTQRYKVSPDYTRSLLVLSCTQREVKARLEANMRMEIEQEFCRDMDKQRMTQEAWLKETFEEKLMVLLEKVIQEHKEAMADEREQLLLKLDQAQQATEAALKKAEEATTETKRMIKMLEQLSLELEKATEATEVARRRAEESVGETKKMAEKLEQANLQAERAEVAAKAVLQADEAPNQ